MEFYSAIKKNEIMTLEEKWLELEIIMLCKISKTKKDKHHMCLSSHAEPRFKITYSIYAYGCVYRS